jgi:hypothetical protein
MKTMFAVLALGLVLSSGLLAQETSVETFNAIRFEHSSNPGQAITLSAPTGLTAYTLELPSTPSPTNRRYSFSRLGSSGALSWYATPLGSAGQIPFFESDEELTGTPNMMWDNTNKTMSLYSTTNTNLFSVSKAATILTADTIAKIIGSYTSAGASALGMAVSVTSTPSGNPASPSRATGLRVTVSGADTNVAATFMGGRSGFGTTTPSTTMDVLGDVAFRELNYTGTLNATNDNVNFDGQGNRYSFVRISSTLTSDVQINGIAGGYNGKLLRIYNSTGKTIKIKNLGSSTPANSIKTSSNADLLLLSGNTYEFVYSGSLGNWLVTFSGPSELAQYNNQTVGPITNNTTLPTTTASYLQVTTETSNNKYSVFLDNGTTAGQILVVQNNGPKPLTFNGSNIALSSANSDLSNNEAIVFIWSGTKWVQVARAQN